MSYLDIPRYFGNRICQESEASVSASESVSASASISVSASVSASVSISASPSISASGCIYYPLLDFDLHGFGTDSKFAYQKYEDTGNPADLPVVLYVDDDSAADASSDATHGTLEWAIGEAYPRIIVFETSGTIDYRGVAEHLLEIQDDYCWIAGNTAPSPGIELLGVTLFISADHVLVQHITMGLGDNPTKNYANADVVNVDDALDGVCVDHCTIRWGSDEVLSGYGSGPSNFTISNSLVYEPQEMPMTGYAKTEGTHAYLMGTYDYNWSCYRNLHGFSTQRNPFSDQTQYIEVINCLGYNAATAEGTGRMLADFKNGNQQVNYIGNDARAINNGESNVRDDYAGIIWDSIGGGFKMYAHDNDCQYRDDNPGATDEECIWQQNPALWTNEVAPLWDISGYDIWAASNTRDNIIAYSGPRFLDADDLRVLDDIENDNARDIIQSVNDLPARVINIDSTQGDVSAGYDWSGGGSQQFDLEVDNGGGYGAKATITLNALCNNITDVVNHVNAQINAEGTYSTATDVICYKLYINNAGSELWVGLRTVPTGADQKIRISASGVTVSLDWENGEYEGSDSPCIVGTRAVNTHSLTPPSNPHLSYNNYLTRLEAWILLDCPDNLCIIDESESVSISSTGCAEATAVINAMDDEPDGTRKEEIRDLVCALVDDGWWARMDGLWIFAAHSNTGDTETINFINPAGTSATITGTVTFTVDEGLKGAGGVSDHVNTHYNPSTDATNFAQDDGTIGIWIMDNVQEGTKDFEANGGADDVYALCRNSGDLYYWRVNQASTSSSAASSVTTSVGLHMFTRRGATDTEAYHDGVSVASSSVVSTAVPNADLYVCGAPGGEGTKRTAMLFVMDGISDSEALDLYTLINTYKWW